jgi:putative FmdB family regulatory protein
MPTYEYACKACGEHLEVVQSFMDEPLTECPNCGGVLRKVFSPIGIAFKGSGFYKTDSRPAAKSGSKSESKSESKTESKSESKPKAAEKTSEAKTAAS